MAGAADQGTWGCGAGASLDWLPAQRSESATSWTATATQDEVREDERTAASMGISAVPFFVVDRALGASGAQPAEVLLDLLERGWAVRPAMSVVAGGATCDVNGC